MPKLRLSQKAAKLIEPDPTKQVLYRDTEVPGLALRVTKAGAKTFVLNYTVNHRERRMRIGEFPQPWTVGAARDEARNLKRKIDQGIDPLEERKKVAQAPTLGELWVVFRDDHLPTVSQKHAKEQVRYWEKRILPALGTRKLEALSFHDVDVLHRDISRDAPVLANRVLASLRKALSIAKRRRWVTENVAQGGRSNSESGRQRYLGPDELSTFLSALDRMPSQKAANAIRLLLLTGARRSEVLGAQWREFDLDNEIWAKPASRTKTRKQVTIPLSRAAVELLKGMASQRQSDFLFPSRTGRPVQDIKYSWSWLMKETGLKDFRLHDLRHTHASLLVSRGASLEIIGNLLGHTQTQTTARYAHLMDAPLRHAVAEVDAQLADASSNKERE